MAVNDPMVVSMAAACGCLLLQLAGPGESKSTDGTVWHDRSWHSCCWWWHGSTWLLLMAVLLLGCRRPSSVGAKLCVGSAPGEQVGGCRSCVTSPVIGGSREEEEEEAVCGSWPRKELLQPVVYLMAGDAGGEGARGMRP